MLNQEDHEIDLVFQAMSKRIKKKLSDEEVEDLMEELSNTVTKHVKLACKKKLERQNISQNMPQPQIPVQVQAQPNPPPMIPMNGNNQLQPQTTVDMSRNIPPMPAL